MVVRELLSRRQRGECRAEAAVSGGCVAGATRSRDPWASAAGLGLRWAAAGALLLSGHTSVHA